MSLPTQVSHLLNIGYPAFAGLSPVDFLQLVKPLLEEGIQSPEHRPGAIPLLLVVKSTLVPTRQAVEAVEVKGNFGVVNTTPVTPDSFLPLPNLNIPPTPIYALLDVEPGRNYLNIPPSGALPAILESGRSPLTIDEGVALLTHCSTVLTDRQLYCPYSLLGSRRQDQRVPAVWLSARRPRLGWCWDNNPHTWLGSASCRARVSLS